MLTSLFRNLNEYLQLNYDFNENALTTLESLDFAAKKTGVKVGEKLVQKNGRVITCDPNKTYPCGKRCLNQSKPCSNPVTGQAKTFAEFLKLKQNEITKKETEKPVEPTQKETKEPEKLAEVTPEVKQPEPLPDVNLADFESVAKLGQVIAERYLKEKVDPEVLKQMEDDFTRISEEANAAFLKTIDALDQDLDETEHQKLSDELDSLLAQQKELALKINAYKAIVSIDQQKIYENTKIEHDKISSKLQDKLSGEDKIKFGLINTQKITLAKKRERIEQAGFSTDATKYINDYLDSSQRLVEAQKEYDNQRFGDNQNLVNLLLSNNGISDEQANTWLTSLGKRTDKAKQADTFVKEAYRITGGNIPKLKKVIYKTKRASANKNGSLNVGANVNKAVIFHEVGHFLEYSDPELKTSANQFLQKRAEGKKKKLSKLTGINLYSPFEEAVPDKFIDPYVGKIYGDQSTEIISMGLERFSSPKKMAEFREKDPEHFHYILGILAHVNNFKG